MPQLKVYRAESAARELGISLRQLQRLTPSLNKTRTHVVGSHRIYLYTDADLDKLRARKTA